MSRKHARLGPSDAARWMTCPGAINATAKFERKPTVYSAEGSWAHHIREDCLELGLDAHDFIGHKMYVEGYVFEWRHEDANYLQPGIDRLRQFEGELFVEYQVNLNRWAPGNFGTLDSGIVGKDLIVINDLKWGKGIPVSAEWNYQQLIYALGFWDNVARHHTDATDFLIMIDQPRTRGGPREIEFDDLDDETDDTDDVCQPGEFRITLDELLEFGKKVKAAAAATHDPDAPRIPSAKGCFWCEAARRGICPEYEEWSVRSMGITFDDLDEADELGITVSPRQGMTPSRRTVFIQSWPAIKRFYDQQHAIALMHALAGEFDEVPRLKAIDGRAPKRTWEDEAMAEAFLRRKKLNPEKIFTKKLISPAAAETELGIPRNQLPRSLVKQGRPKPVLVSVNDPKPARLEKIEFDNLENDEDD